MKKTLYFAYGANLNKAAMAFRCPDAKPIGRGSLHGHRRVFRGVADVIEAEDTDKVQGALWEITPECERALDRFEGFPRLYVKKTVSVFCHASKQFVKAMAYVMNEGEARGLAYPSQGYYITISRGLRDFGWGNPAQVELMAQAEEAGLDEDLDRDLFSTTMKKKKK